MNKMSLSQLLLAGALPLTVTTSGGELHSSDNKKGSKQVTTKASTKDDAKEKIHTFKDIKKLCQYERGKGVQPLFEEYNTSIPRMKYMEATGSEYMMNEHWGQRKLLLSEIEFLSMFCEPDKEETIVYAGSAPGTHIPYLSTLFPNVIWHLIDPRDHDKSLAKYSKVTTYKGFFDDDLAKQFADKGVLFISDIRNMSIDDPNLDLKQTEEIIKGDMAMQKNWINIMKPRMSMFKFRLSFFPGKIDYFDGQIMMQAWAPQKSTELRLITDGSKMKVYDNTEFEQRLFYFNAILRNCAKYDAGQSDKISQDYSTAREYSILTKFILKYRPDVTNRDDAILTMMNEISRELKIPNRKPFLRGGYPGQERWIHKQLKYQSSSKGKH